VAFVADKARAVDSGASSDGSETETDTELAAYGQAVDVVAHVPTLSGAIAAAGVAGLVWIWRQIRHRRAAGTQPNTRRG
jgi:hypothetical protein